MDRHKFNPYVQDVCILALCTIAIFNPDTHQVLGNSGALEAIINAGRNHFDSELVHQRVCNNGVCCLTDESMENRDKFRELGAIEHCLAAWDRFPNNSWVRYGTGASAAGMSYGNIPNRKRYIEGGFVEKGLQGMLDMPRSEQRIREEVMQGFNGLSSYPYVLEIHDQMIEKGVLDSMLMIYRENMDHDITMTNANRVLENLIRGSKKNADLIVAKGFPKYLSKLIFHFQGRPGWALYVQVDGTSCTNLLLLAEYSSENRLAVLNAGAVAKAREAYLAQPYNDMVQDSCGRLAAL